MDLFLQPQFEKTAMGSTRMPEDPNAWPQEILQQLFKEVPYMSDFSPHVVMDKVDAEKGYAFGHVTVMNRTETQLDAGAEAMSAGGIRQVRVPIVIKDGELFPLDLLITDDAKVLPLTESRLRAAIFRPQAFDVTAKTPGDQSMIGQLYPPYRQNYGFGGGAGGAGATMDAGVSKEGSALERFLSKEALKLQVKEDGNLNLDTEEDKKRGIDPDAQVPAAEPALEYAQPQPEQKMASLLNAILPTMNISDLEHFKDTIRDPNIRLAYEKNAGAVVKPVSLLLELESERPKLASVMHLLLRPTVTQVTKLDEGYLVKSANHRCWAPQSEVLDRGAAFKKLGAKVVLAADTSGAATMSEGAVAEEPAAPPDSDMQTMGPASEFGLYKVQTTEGQELVGYIIPNLIDVDGIPLPISLFTNGSQAAVQGDVLGVPVPGDAMQLPTGDAPQGYGAFFTPEGDGIMATIPMTLAGSYQPTAEEPAVFQGETYDGRPVEVSVQPNIQTVVGMEQEGRMLVPAHWQWLPLEQSEAVDLVSSEENAPEKEASARRSLASVEVVSGGQTFSVRGSAVEKLASDEREFLDLDGAMFLLAGLGIAPAYGIKKLAEAMTGREPVQVKIGRYIKLAEEQAKEATQAAREALSRMPSLRRDLFKEAGFVTDPEAVDTMLSLGFINPENVTTFIGYMPTIEKTQESLCNLLFASRVGLSDIPTSALETAVRSSEEVLEGLKTMAFQGPAEYGG